MQSIGVLGPCSRWSATFFCAIFLSFSAGATAQSSTERYLTRLQDEGFADLALEYLDQLAAAKKLPESLQESFDYHYGKVLLSAADGAAAELEKKFQDQALQRFEKYRAAHPKTDEAIDARGEIAAILLARAHRLLAEAKNSEKKEDATAKRASARQLLEQARPELTATIDQYTAALTEAKKEEAAPKRGKGKKETAGAKSNRVLQLESSKVSVELNRAMVEYLAGLAFDRSDEKEKKASDAQLKVAIAEFDKVFQRYRASGALIASFALLWQGRVYQEMGEYGMAGDIFREILSAEPETLAKLDQFRFDLYAQARLFWYQTMNTAAKPEQVIDNKYYSAVDWLKQNTRDRRTRLGLGIQLELAKAFIALGEKQEAGSRERRRLMREAITLLNDGVCRYSSEFMAEGFALREKYASEIRGEDDQMSSFDEALFAADTALGAEDWKRAIEGYEKALTLVKRDTAEEKVASAKYRLAYAHSRAGNTEKCIAVGEALARERPAPKTAADGAGLVLAAYWKLYLQATAADAKQGFADKLLDFAQFVEQNFPRLAQADYARYLKGYLYAAMKKFEESAQAYGSISKQAQNHAEGQLRAGQMYWLAHLVASQNQEGSSSEFVDKANAALLAAVAAYEEEEKKTRSKPIGWVETQLKRADIALKTGKGNEAAQIVDPLVQMVSEGKPEGIAKLSIDILVTALETSIATSTLDRAETIVDVVLKSDQQAPGRGEQVTAVLVRLGRRFQEQIEGHEKAGKNGEAKETRAAFEKFLAKIATRGAQNFSSLRYIGESYFALGDKTKSAELFGRALDLAAGKPDVVPAANRDKIILGLKLRRIAALRDSKQFDDAFQMINKLLEEHEANSKGTFPLAYEMEKGTVLQAWAAEDSSRLQAALDQWTQVANKLRTVKSKPEQYFLARLGMAQVMRLMKNTDGALQVLRSTMALSPDCGGPATKKKFEELLTELKGSPTTAAAGS